MIVIKKIYWIDWTNIFLTVFFKDDIYFMLFIFFELNFEVKSLLRACIFKYFKKTLTINVNTWIMQLTISFWKFHSTSIVFNLQNKWKRKMTLFDALFTININIHSCKSWKWRIWNIICVRFFSSWMFFKNWKTMKISQYCQFLLMKYAMIFKNINLFKLVQTSQIMNILINDFKF